ncbi:hypothetical protein AB2B38_009870 [Balneola sp. MJW-20]|uniref:hypothetical protein n=1 Tax=Gracilimonas aurantiaca TaxID=3234185 RepID=UPI003466655A
MKKIYKNNPDLDRLEKIMNHDIEDKMPAAGFLFHGVYGMYGVLFSVLMTPLVMYSLYKLSKYGWLITFIVLALCPILSALLFISSMGLYYIFLGTGLMIWVVYMAVLRATIIEWREPRFFNPDNPQS